MSVTSRILSLAVLFGPLLMRAEKPAPPTGTISAAQILEKYVAATGGLEARRKLTRLTVSGDFGFSLRHPLGTYSFYYKAPSSDMLEVLSTSHGIAWIGHDEGALVTRSTAEGISMFNGAGIGIVEEDWLSLLESDFQRRYARIELVGLAEVAKRWAYALRFTPKAGDPQLRYYDAESFLLVRLDQIQRFKMTKDDRPVVYKVESYFTDYRDVAGVQLPKQINVSRDIGDLMFTIPRITSDADIPDSVFVRPKTPK